MITATELKNGTAFQIGGTPYKVLKYKHQKIARGGGTVKLTLKDLNSGRKVERTLNSSEKVEEIETIKKPLQFLYSDDEKTYFMDTQTYGQVEIDKELVADELGYITDGDKVSVLFWEDRPLSVDIPAKVSLEVVDTAPGVKGNSATNIYKQAELKNGVKLKVPLFIEKGDRVVVDTQTGEYVERAK